MTAVLTPAELAEIRERAESATAPPWRAENGYVRAPERTVADCRYMNSTNNATFIAAAPTDIRRLLSHVAAVEGERDRLRAEVESAGVLATRICAKHGISVEGDEC